MLVAARRRWHVAWLKSQMTVEWGCAGQISVQRARYLRHPIDGNGQQENHETLDHHHGHEVGKMEGREHTFLGQGGGSCIRSSRRKRV